MASDSGLQMQEHEDDVTPARGVVEQFNPLLGPMSAPSAVAAYQEIEDENASLSRIDTVTKVAEELYLAQDWAGALKSYIRALRLASRDKDIAYRVACCYSEMEELPLSMEWLATAISWGFQNHEAAICDPELNNLRVGKHTRDDFVRLSRCLPVWTSDNNPDAGSEDLRSMSVQQVVNFQYQKGQKHMQDKEWEVRKRSACRWPLPGCWLQLPLRPRTRQTN